MLGAGEDQSGVEIGVQPRRQAATADEPRRVPLEQRDRRGEQPLLLVASRGAARVR